MQVTVFYYDKVPEPPRNTEYEGEVIGWRDSQLIIRVKEYAVLRFWKDTGLEVGNADHVRRGFRVDVPSIAQSIKPPPGVKIAIDTDA